jgi:hypothetical protein
MAGLPGVRQQQALRHVGQPHRPAAVYSEGDPDSPLPPKFAPHQKPDQPAGVPEALIQHCNEIWEDQRIEEAANATAAAAAATARPHSPFQDTRRPSSPLRGKGPAGNRSGSRRSPTPGPPRGSGSDRLCSTTPVLVPRPRSVRRAADGIHGFYLSVHYHR